MMNVSAIARVLGGEKTLGRKVSSAQQDLIHVVRRGLRVSAVDALIEELGVPRAKVLPALRIARRTMERRKQTGRLLPAESERVYRLAKILALAESVLGSRDKARHWLNAANRALGNVTPLSLLETEPGADEVTNVFGADRTRCLQLMVVSRVTRKAHIEHPLSGDPAHNLADRIRVNQIHSFRLDERLYPGRTRARKK